LVENEAQSIKILPRIGDMIRRRKLAHERFLVVLQILPGFELEIGGGKCVAFFVEVLVGELAVAASKKVSAR
jgi:hypothetical protein